VQLGDLDVQRPCIAGLASALGNLDEVQAFLILIRRHHPQGVVDGGDAGRSGHREQGISSDSGQSLRSFCLATRDHISEGIRHTMNAIDSGILSKELAEAGLNALLSFPPDQSIEK
jgi:hypothetical protein